VKETPDINKTIWLDTETGGLDPSRHALLSIGIHDHLGGLNLEIKIKPAKGLDILKEASAINGYNEKEWEGALNEALAIPFVLSIIKPYHFIGGQNVSFDLSFLHAAIERNKIRTSITRRTRDLQTTATDAVEAGVMKPLESYSLDSIAKSLGLKRDSSTHSALEDATLTALCHKAILKKYQKTA
jgi:DNA polymerase III epsilon subunit-like protein